MPSHNLANHTCTFFRFLHIDDGGACAAGHREWERTNRPGVAPVRYMTREWRKQDKKRGRGQRCQSLLIKTYLSWTASCSDIWRCIWDAGCGRLIWPWHVTWMSVLTPAVGSWLVHSWRWVALVLCHVVGLRVVRRIRRRVGRALLLLLSDRWIYRNVRVRLHVV
jgi:hypothetical protein